MLWNDRIRLGIEAAAGACIVVGWVAMLILAAGAA